MTIRRILWHQEEGGSCGCGCGCGDGSAKLPNSKRLKFWEEAADDTIVCECARVDKRTIVEAIRNGAFTAPLIKVLTGIGRGTSCTTGHECLHHLTYLLQLYGQTTLSDALFVFDEES